MITVLIEMLDKASNGVGLVGVVLLLSAYGLLSVNKLSAKQISYQLLNLSGAVLILFSLMFHWNTASVLIEIAWITISLVGIYRNVRGRSRKQLQEKTNSLNNLYSINSSKRKTPITN